MAKSYVTKFVEYVDTCKNNLKVNLIDKGQTVNENDTLDALVNRVASITSPPAQGESSNTYVRDSALPDLDAMFEADPLREVNGGEYSSVAYGVFYLFDISSSVQQQISIYYSSGGKSKIVFGNSGREIEITSTSQKSYTVNDDEIYTLANGRKVYILKAYSTRDVGSAFNNVANAIPLEIIEDNVTSCSSQYNPFSLLYYKVYATFRGTTPHITSFLSDSYANTTCIVNGNFSANAIQVGIKSLTINGDYVGTASSVTYNGSSTTPVSKLVVPAISQQASKYGSVSLNMASCPNWTTDSELYIPNSYTFIGSSANTVNNIRTLHIPNSLSTTTSSNYEWFTHTSSPTFRGLVNLTISPNAFNLLKTSFTFYGDKMPNLSRQSLLNLFEGLGDRTGMTTATLRISKIHRKNVTDEEIASLQAKNWTIAVV